MQVQDIEFVGLRTPLPSPAVFSWGSAEERNVGLVRVVLSDGTEGWGETSVTFPLWSLEERAATVRGIAALATGRRLESSGDIARIVSEMTRSTDRLRLLWSPTGISAAIGAIEMALWDAWGRVQDRPVWEILGGADIEIPLYAVGFGGSPTEVAEITSMLLGEGYAAVKIRVGFEPDADVALVEAVSAVAGDRLYVDVNMGWGRSQAAEMIPRLNDFGLGWLEEPLSRDDREGLRLLRDIAKMPLAAGENCYSEAELVSLAESRLVEVVMPDLARVGGLGAGIAGARTARANDLGYSPHHYASDIGFAAMATLCAVVGEPRPILRDVSPWPIRTELLSEPLSLEHGVTRPYSGAGLSPAPDPHIIEEHRVL
ncbi:mandelate racemase/muconate lactonizing enzyme family protein [Microbacterium sp. USHLN186]|uniref:mandelate racemase/muconate lactonizing enzyme family protein n=1 Tax=Microbacterium sp. USHLN186 TaxID=3081286 RepID=UPI003015D75C